MKTSTLKSSQIPREGQPRGICRLQGATPSLVQASTMGVLGHSDTGQKQTDLCLLLTLGQESCSELHPFFVLHQHRAPVVLDGRISRRGKCRSPQTPREACTRKKTSNLRCTSDSIQIIQKNKNYCNVKTKACTLTAKKHALFFF